MLSFLKKLLSPFFSSSQCKDSFRVQKNTGLIIGGSISGCYFTEEILPDVNLDTFVQLERRGPVLDFMKSINYTFMPTAGQLPTLDFMYDLLAARILSRGHIPLISFVCAGEYSGHTIVMVLNFWHDQSGRIVQVVLTKGMLVYTILQFHSTCVMNFILYGYAISLYPKATFMSKRSAHSYNISSNGDMGTVNKYKAHGFIYEEKDVTQSPELYFPRINHRIGDDFSWMIDMRPEDGPERENPLTMNMWRMMGCNTIDGFWIDAGIMHAGRLDESYSIASTVIYLVYPDTLM
ncbi:hypothetical protein ARMGADRAFT_1081997 [Armillaria gallica]|uniref:Uncharacterized protein n=1 Tax=Armillaria gallica TaxID=47427 RepID=A0A2H3DSG8_ARMGA|nr:hypothetical protein ARMGADRAFT_1081997 [Armillaria gallica]